MFADASGSELGHLADWASKLNGAIARLAGLLHLAAHLRDGWDQPISTDTVTDAARLGHYYLAHALAVFDLMDTDPVLHLAASGQPVPEAASRRPGTARSRHRYQPHRL